MSAPKPPPFERVEAYAGPELVYARWWHESMALVDPVARRRALVGVAAVLASAALVGTCVRTCSDDDVEVTPRDALAAQREYGWSVGSDDEPLAWGDPASGAFAASLLDGLATELAPRSPELRPYYVPTLFQAVTARPTQSASSASAAKPLRDALRPVRGPALDASLGRGRALAELLAEAPAGRAVVVDLPGPEAVAFATGLARLLDPVFLFDNWPHPRGVVPAHLTLAAAATYAPDLARAAEARPPGAMPAFVLDEARLAAYSDASDRFDNRYVAKLPSAAALSSLGVKELLYVRRGEGVELDDLNADFVALEGAGIPVRMVAADTFVPAGAAEDWAPSNGGDARAPTSPAQGAAAEGGPRYVYRSPAMHLWFLPLYGWGAPPRGAPSPPPGLPPAPTYRPAPRPTVFGPSFGPSRARPSGFGTVGVLRSRASGTVVGVGSPTSRAGSWGRSGGSWGG